VNDTASPPAPGALPARTEAARLRDAGRHAEAAEVLQRAVEAFPQDADALAELGLTLTLLGRAQPAEACFRRALALAPDDVFTLSNLGGVLLQLRRTGEAEACFRRVLELEPGQPQALRNLAVILRDTGQLAEAKACGQAAFERAPSLDAALLAYLSLTPILGAAEDIAVQRESYADGLKALAASPVPFAYRGEKATLPWFFLAYHDADDRALAAATAEVIAAKLGLDPGATPADWRPPQADGRRIRVAFCSEFFFEHTIGRLYRGLIRELNRSRFEVIVLHGSHSRADAFRQDLDLGADRAIVLPASPQGQREVVRALRPDVLFFPDIGMSAQTYVLASARLAPVQAVSWGHPATTGLPTLDYFVSADGAEPAGAEAQYGERLIRLPRLPTHYQAPATPALPRASLGLPSEGALYGCPQSLFKLHPDFDAILGEICRRDPTGHIVLLQARNPAWTEALRARWARSQPILLERAIFLPPLSHAGFMAHLAHLDVLLDPPHFGSGNTLYEGAAAGVPIVTWPGRFMRGRLVAAAYAQIGLAQAPVADSLADYARLAVDLAQDGARRRRLSDAFKALAAQRLFNDGLAVRAFETFLAAAVEAAAAGEPLPSGWRPDLQESLA